MVGGEKLSALVKELKVRISADTNGLKGALNGISGDISRVSKDFEGLKKVGEGISSVHTCHVTYHALITWHSCTDHVADHTLLT